MQTPLPGLEIGKRRGRVSPGRGALHSWGLRRLCPHGRRLPPSHGWGPSSSRAPTAACLGRAQGGMVFPAPTKGAVMSLRIRMLVLTLVVLAALALPLVALADGGPMGG